MAGDDRQDFEVSMTQSVDVDSLFRDAVSAIDAGEVERLQRLIDEHPFLVSARLESPGAWLRERVGLR